MGAAKQVAPRKAGERQRGGLHIGTRMGDLEILGPLGDQGPTTEWVGALRGPRGESQAYRLVRGIRDDVPGRRDYERILVRGAKLGMHAKHPSLAEIHGLAFHMGQAYLVADLVSGVPLERLLAQLESCDTRLPVGWALRIATELARALEVLHAASDERGEGLHLIHRDVSLANVRLTFQGSPVLERFGIGDLVTEPSGHVSPEQASGEPTDARADVYALGSLLLELLWGQRIAGERLSSEEGREATLANVAADRDVPIAALQTIRACLAAAPEGRPSARRVVQELETALRRLADPTAIDLADLARCAQSQPSAKGFRSVGMEPRGSGQGAPGASEARPPNARPARDQPAVADSPGLETTPSGIDFEDCQTHMLPARELEAALREAFPERETSSSFAPRDTIRVVPEDFEASAAADDDELAGQLPGESTEVTPVALPPATASVPRTSGVFPSPGPRPRPGGGAAAELPGRAAELPFRVWAEGRLDSSTERLLLGPGIPLPLALCAIPLAGFLGALLLLLL